MAEAIVSKAIKRQFDPDRWYLWESSPIGRDTVLKQPTVRVRIPWLLLGLAKG